ncbi:MAG: phosphomannomutase [Planctomycetaceae bacterium]|jgi:phosphomannomutase|nr:phosphomannomutase [Planctomycetaceae bacterium]
MKILIDQLMNQSGVKFGTSGARGLAAEMNDLVCFAYTLGFLQYLVREKVPVSASNRVMVAYDLRESSPRIARAVRKAINHFGFQPVDCQTIPTPVVALYGMSEHVPAIMVTGSHIPENRNGIKFYLPTGEILKKDETGIKQQTVEIPDELFDSNGSLKPTECEFSSETDHNNAKQYYLDRFLRAFPVDFLAGFRIGLYEHSAVGRDLLYELYTALGATVTRLGRSETFVAVDTEAVRDEDQCLARTWATGQATGQKNRHSDNPPFDAILSTDGDSDRPLLFDEHGEWIRGDIAGILTSRFLLADCVVTPLTSNTALERSGWFKKIVRTKIGSPYVIEAMQEAVSHGYQRVVGYEANGGFLTANSMLFDEEESQYPLLALPTRDPAIVHIAVLRHAKDVGVPLSEMIHYLPRRIVMSDRLQNFPTELAQRKIEELVSGGDEMVQLIFAAFGELQTIDHTDGIRMTFGDQDIVHLRYSGNAPELRCYTEADTKERATSLLYRTMTILDTWRRRSQNDSYPYQH